MDGEIDSGTLRSLLADDTDLRIVDVRDRDAYAKGHLPGSECVPFSELPEAITTLHGATHVVTVCPHGEASVKAARLIAAYEGLGDDATVQSLAGGIDAWDGEVTTADDAGVDAPP